MSRLAGAGFVLALVTPLAQARGDDRASIRETVLRAMETYGVPGVGVALIDDFQVVWSAEFGVAEPGRPVGPETLFQAASLSKPVAARNSCGTLLPAAR